MNYINKDKNYMTDAERIRYLEESIRELRKEKENIKKEKGELKARLEEENKKLKEYNWELIENHKKDISILCEENKKLEHKNKLQEKALIKLCLKHHYDSIVINWEIVIDMENYTVVEKKKPKEQKLF